MLSRILTITLASCTLIATAQDLQHLQDKHWTSGDITYYSAVNGNVVNFMGGTCHEGGYSFGLEPVNGVDGKFILRTCNDPELGNPEFAFVPLMAPLGASVTLREVDGHECLVVNHRGMVTDVLVQHDDDLYDLISADIRQMLSGVYLDEYHQTLVITPDYVSLADICPARAYEVMEMDETPTNVIALKTDDPREPQYLRIALTDGGIAIYQVGRSEYDDWVDPVLLRRAQLQWREADGVLGRWPWTSTQILTTDRLSCYSKAHLRLMRNEIMARHHYRFSNQELAEYFDREPWYTPGDPTNKVRLTEVEALNVELIKSMEKADDHHIDLTYYADEECPEHRASFSMGAPGGAVGYGLKAKVAGGKEATLYWVFEDGTPLVTGEVIHASGQRVMLMGNVATLYDPVTAADGHTVASSVSYGYELYEVGEGGRVGCRYFWVADDQHRVTQLTWVQGSRSGDSRATMVDFPYGQVSLPQATTDWQDGLYVMDDSPSGQADAIRGELSLRRNANGSLHYTLHVSIVNDRYGDRSGDIWPEGDIARISLGFGLTIALRNYGDRIVIYDHVRSTLASPYAFGDRVQPEGCFVRR